MIKVPDPETIYAKLTPCIVCFNRPEVRLTVLDYGYTRNLGLACTSCYEDCAPFAVASIQKTPLGSMLQPFEVVGVLFDAWEAKQAAARREAWVKSFYSRMEPNGA